MLYTVPNKQTWNSILHNSNLGVRGPRYTRKFLEPKNRVNRGKGVVSSTKFHAFFGTFRRTKISINQQKKIVFDLKGP